jgi:hypothetical protein
MTDVADRACRQALIAGRDGRLRHGSKLLGCFQVATMLEQLAPRTQQIHVLRGKTALRPDCRDERST